MSQYFRHIAILLFIGHLLSCASTVSAADAEAKPLEEKDLYPAWYTTPSKAPFRVPGLSLVAFFNPTIPLSPINEYRLTHPVSVGGGLELDLSRSSAFRLTYGYSRADYPGKRLTNPVHNFARHSISLDHMWNLTNHYFGFDPARSWEFLLVTGATYGWAVSDPAAPLPDLPFVTPPTQQYWQGQLGLQIRKTLSPRLSAFLEPVYYFAQTQYDFYRNGANYDDGIAIKAGLKYRVIGSKHTTPWFDHTYFDAANLGSLSPNSMSLRENLYIQNLFGLNFSEIQYVPQENRALSNYSITVAAGQWFNPAWGYRLGFTDRQLLTDIVVNQTYDGQEVHDYQTWRQSFARLEGVISLPAFFDQVSFGRFSAEISGGIEYGNNRHHLTRTGNMEKIVTKEKKAYAGITAATQLKWFINNHAALVGEARYSYFDRRAAVFTPSVGVEYYKSPFRRYSSRRGLPSPVTGSSHFDLPDMFSNTFVEAGGGFLKHSNQINSDIRVAPMMEIAIGHHFDALHSFRLKEHLAYYRTVKYHHPLVKQISNFNSQLSIDYMFDVTNYWLGVDPYRRFSMKAFAGPLYSARQLTRSDKMESIHRIGINVGLQHLLHVNPHFAFTLEPRYVGLLEDMNQYTLTVGGSYTLPSPDYIYSRSNSAQSKRKSVRGNMQQQDSPYYIQATAGLQLMQAFYNVDLGTHGGFDVVVGRQLCPNIFVQGNLFYQNLNVGQPRHRIDHVYGLRAEFVADFLNMVWPDANQRGYGFDVQAGYTVAHSRYYHNDFHGPTAAGQFRIRLGKTPLWWLLQTRLQTTTTPSNNSMLLLSTGLHITL